MKYIKKNYCENTEGNPIYGVCKQKSYHDSELHIDHKDGNPFNDVPENKWTICSNCHERKTHFMGDDKTQGRGNISTFSQNSQKSVDRIVEMFTQENWQKTRENLRLPLLEGFKNSYGNGQMNMGIAPTSFGKTFDVFNKWAPYHFAKGGRIHVFLSPFTESCPHDEVMGYVMWGQYEHRNHQPMFYHSSRGIDWSAVNSTLQSGYNVTIVSSDQYMKGHIEKLLMLVNKYDTLVTRDEASYGMLSSWEHSSKVLGWNYSSDTLQTYYKNFEKLFNAGAKTYGITATPTREMTEAIGADWNIINNIINGIELTPYRKWYRNLNIAKWSNADYHDPSILSNEMNELFQKVEVANLDIKNFNETFECSDIKNEKVTGLIVTEPGGGERVKIQTIDIVNFIKSDNSKMSKEHTLLVVTADGWEEYNGWGIKVNSGKGDDFQSKLNDSNEPAHYLVVINKAIYGVNINTLGVGLIFRQYGNEASDTNEAITLTPEQLGGRFNRINWSNEKIVYLAKNHGPYAVHKYLSMLGIGCFDIKAPNSEMFNTAFANFKNNHGTDIADALKYIFSY